MAANHQLVVLLILVCAVNALRILSVVEQSCVVHTDEGVLNLTLLAGDKHPAFNFVFDSVYTLYWNPCKDVMPIYCSGSGGAGEALLGTSIGSGPSICKNLGLKKNSEFAVDDEDQLVLNYDGAVVTFICKVAPNNTFSVPDADHKSRAELIGPASCLQKAVPAATTTMLPVESTSSEPLDGSGFIDDEDH